MTKTKKSRWQALALAALVLVGGTVAVPQAAEARTWTTKLANCQHWGTTCTLKVKARDDVYFAVQSNWTDKSRYTVRTSSGRLLCRGTIYHNEASRSCWFGTYTGTVKITATKGVGQFLKLYASY